MIRLRHPTTIMLGLLCGAALLQPALADTGNTLNAAERSAIIKTLSDKIKGNYVYPDVGERVAAALLKKDAAGGYAAATSPQALSAMLSPELRTLSKDLHFRAAVDPGFREPPVENRTPSRAETDAARERWIKRAYGIEAVQRLPGNVGYLDLRGFGPTEFVGAAYSQAMSLLAGTDALILDLRRNGGGKGAGRASSPPAYAEPGGKG